MKNLAYMDNESWWAARVKHGAYLGGRECAEHYIWRTMLSRCNRKNDKDYPNYGGRGITVCANWLVYETFIRDMGPRPSKGHSIDRINVNKGYCPENCRCATRSVQQKNKTSTRKYIRVSDGFVGVLSEAANMLGISKALACWRFKNWGTFLKGEEWLELPKVL